MLNYQRVPRLASPSWTRPVAAPGRPGIACCCPAWGPRSGAKQCRMPPRRCPGRQNSWEDGEQKSEFHGIHMDSWDVDGSFVRWSWDVDGMLMGVSWDYLGMLMGCWWEFREMIMGCWWEFHGIHGMLMGVSWDDHRMMGFSWELHKLWLGHASPTDSHGIYHPGVRGSQGGCYEFPKGILVKQPHGDCQKWWSNGDTMRISRGYMGIFWINHIKSWWPHCDVLGRSIPKWSKCP